MERDGMMIGKKKKTAEVRVFAVQSYQIVDIHFTLRKMRETH